MQQQQPFKSEEPIMNRCAKTGLTDSNWRTILDIVNVFDSDSLYNLYPEMGTPQFKQERESAFKALLAHVERNNIQKSHGGMMVPQYGPGGADSTKPAPVDHMSLAYQQWIHDS